MIRTAYLLSADYYWEKHDMIDNPEPRNDEIEPTSDSDGDGWKEVASVFAETRLLFLPLQFDSTRKGCHHQILQHDRGHHGLSPSDASIQATMSSTGITIEGLDQPDGYSSWLINASNDYQD
ncbi:uncharacterized protein ARMOST_02309 [Armillaria ostoyae]|uniref:Uncharacterized protein n=1 Tax=Armillaria ostoyae TaxID=47428 RepID=A0A284QRC9_ARMOS|nr:uncharacterized protein ARMOST_02309 [Armillaria ostoyae]